MGTVKSRFADTCLLARNIDEIDQQYTLGMTSRRREIPERPWHILYVLRWNRMYRSIRVINGRLRDS